MDRTTLMIKVHLDANSLRVELRGAPTACAGRLFALVKPADCEWELERSKRPEYDPMLDALSRGGGVVCKGG